MQTHSLRAAWLQGGVFVALTAGTAVATCVHLRRPFDADTLAIPVAELQAQAKEGALLVRLLQANQVAPAFVARHSGQLAEDIARIGDALRAKDAQPPLADARAKAAQLQASLHQRMAALASAGGRTTAQASSFDTVAGGLDALQHQIKPGH